MLIQRRCEVPSRQLRRWERFCASCMPPIQKNTPSSWWGKRGANHPLWSSRTSDTYCLKWQTCRRSPPCLLSWIHPHTLDGWCRRGATEKKSAKNNVWIQDVKFGAEIVSSWCLFVGTMIRWWWRGGQQRYQAVCNDIVRGSLSIVDCVDVVVTPKVWYLKEM